MNNDLLDIGQLETFVAIIEQDGFQRAARHLNVSQPHVSQQIKRLEVKLGHRLFDRTKRSAILTPEGEVLLIFAKTIFKVADNIRQFFMEPPVEGRLRIGLTDDFVRTALVEVLQLFVSTVPSIYIDVVCDVSSARLFQMLDDDLLDLVVGKGINGWHRGQHLVSLPMVWLTGSPDIPVPEVVPLVLPPEPSDTRRVIIDALKKNERPWRLKLESASVSTLEAGVKAGMGICASHRSFRSAKIFELDKTCGLPDLPNAEYIVDSHREKNSCIKAFEAVLLEVVPALFVDPALSTDPDRGSKPGPDL